MPVPAYIVKSLTELIALRADEQEDEPAVHTGAAEFGDNLQTLSYGQVQRAVDRLARYYTSLDLQSDLDSSAIPPERVIAVLVSTAIDESLLEIALAKLGLTALLLSVNNSVAAVAHLVRQTQATHLIYGPKFEETAREAKQLLANERYLVDLVAEKRFPLWGPGGVDESKIIKVKPRLTPEQECKRTCVILHSSGSTGFPKPVYITHYGLIANIEKALPKSGFSALPLFHGFGHFSIFRCFYYGQPFTLFPPNLPMTSKNICHIIKSSPSPPKQHFAVPYVLKLLAETEEGTRVLADFEAVSFAGAAVPDDLGDRLVAAGVNLISIYGTTETGSLLNSRRDFAGDKAWNWLRAEGPIVDYSVMEDRGSRTFELVVLDGWPPKIMSNRPDNSYATKDLFQQHEKHPTWFKYIGRLDDTLTQTLGEKTNPVPIENTIRGNSPLIQECIVFGDSRPQVGCLILPSEAARDLWEDTSAFKSAIWPTIEQANANAPTHSRILPEMVEILPIDTDIPVATKMSILRPACYKKFASLINAIYDRFENGVGVAKRDINDLGDMEKFITDTIQAALGTKALQVLTPSTDLFAFGIDSLQATRIRNVIGKSIELNGVILGQNIVYEYPSIRQLSTYIMAAKSGMSQAKTDEQQQQVMLEMVERWSQHLYQGDPMPSIGDIVEDELQVVVLTGATGSLGAHILDQLAASQFVSKVICLSRAKSHAESLQRIQDSLAQRSRTLPPSSLNKIVSLAANVNKPDLGLTATEYESLRTSVTAVIHNAWPVNFVLSTESFDEHIGGAVNLLNMTLQSPRKNPPTFYFSSSVGTRQGRPDSVISEDFSDSPSTAAPMGYGRSKWVVEKICEQAALTTRARVGVFRIGQLVGDTENGVWNETEAWPLMFRAVYTIGCLPQLDEDISWLPVNLAAKGISEIVTSSPSAKATAYHILNADTSSSWTTILDGLRLGGLSFDVVDRQTWLQRLGASNSDMTVNPTYKLLSFYQGRIGKEKERAPMEFQIGKTSRVAPSIGGCKAPNAELVALWVKHWKETGFMV